MQVAYLRKIWNLAEEDLFGNIHVRIFFLKTQKIFCSKTFDSGSLTVL